MGYTVGRFWIEMMRTDEATHIVGVRLNVFTAVLVFLGALIYFLRVHGPARVPRPDPAPTRRPGRRRVGDISQVDVSSAAGGRRRCRPATGWSPRSSSRRTEQTGAIPDEDGPGELLDDSPTTSPTTIRTATPTATTPTRRRATARPMTTATPTATVTRPTTPPATRRPAPTSDASATPAKDR